MLNFIPTKIPIVGQLEKQRRELEYRLNELVENSESMKSFIIRIRLELELASKYAQIIKSNLHGRP